MERVLIELCVSTVTVLVIEYGYVYVGTSLLLAIGIVC